MEIFSFVFVIGILLLIGMKRGKMGSEEEYLFAKRDSGVLALTGTLVMTEMNTSTLISFASMGYLVGIRALLLPFVFLIGLLFYALAVAKKWKELNASSCCELFAKRYSPRLAKFASLCLLCAMLGFNATYVKSLILIFSPFFPELTSWQISGALLLLTLMMTLRGGLKAIIRTDVFSLFLTAGVFLVAFFCAKGDFAFTDIQSFSSGANQLPLSFVFSLIILTMFTYILAPWYAQKIFTAKTPKIAFASSILAAVIVFLFYALGVLATAFLRARVSEGVAIEASLPYIINHLMPFGMRGVAYAILFLASATTLSGAWSAMSAMIISDFLPKRNSSQRRGIAITLFLATFSYVLGNTLVDNVFDKLILSNIPVAALSFALLGGFYWEKASTFGAYLSMVVGIIWGIFCYLYFGEQGGYTWYWAVYGIPLIFLSGIAGSLLKLPRKSAIRYE